jgi:hypothetical protein
MAKKAASANDKETASGYRRSIDIDIALLPIGQIFSGSLQAFFHIS